MYVDLTGNCPHIFPDAESAVLLGLKENTYAALRVSRGDLSLVPYGGATGVEEYQEAFRPIGGEANQSWRNLYKTIWIVGQGVSTGTPRVLLVTSEDVELDVSFGNNSSQAVFRSASYVISIQKAEGLLIIKPPTSEVPIVKVSLPKEPEHSKLRPLTLWEHLQE